MPNRTRNPAVPCTAHSSKTGKPCKKYARPGLDVCEVHGGAAPHTANASAERYAERRARSSMVNYGGRRDIGPTEALLEEVQWTAGHVEWLRERVREVEESELTWGVIREKTGGEDWGTTSGAEANVWLKLYQQERVHLLHACEVAIRAGIEERRVKLAEQQGALVAQVIKAILGDLNLTDEQQAQAPQIVLRHLRSLAGLALAA